MASEFRWKLRKNWIKINKNTINCLDPKTPHTKVNFLTTSFPLNFHCFLIFFELIWIFWTLICRSCFPKYSWISSTSRNSMQRLIMGPYFVCLFYWSSLSWFALVKERYLHQLKYWIEFLSGRKNKGKSFPLAGPIWPSSPQGPILLSLPTRVGLFSQVAKYVMTEASKKM